MFFATNNILWNIPSFRLNVNNILQNIVSPPIMDLNNIMKLGQ